MTDTKDFPQPVSGTVVPRFGDIATFMRLPLFRDPAEVELIWKDLFFHTHATAVGAITSLALAAIDTALWDLRC